jgi:D-serine dehydratase
MDLTAAENWIVDGRTKGMPANAAPIRLADIGAQGWSLLDDELPMPLAVVRESAIANNSRWMRAFLSMSGARIAPHGKTTMCPQLFRMQLEDGASAITVATVQQLKVCRDFGVASLLLANQLMGASETRYVLDELRRDPDFRVLSFVDSVANVTELSDAASASSGTLEVLLEIGFAGGRTGCRTLDESLAVARAVARGKPHLVLRGVAGFEGLISGATPGVAEAAVRSYLEFIAEVATAVDAEGLFAETGEIILSAGGSGFFDMVVERLSLVGLSRKTQVMIRSGCYLTHDGHMYRELFSGVVRRHPELAKIGPGLQPALQVWARVQSRPEPRKCILTVGKRDISYDERLPSPALWSHPGTGKPKPMPPGHTVTGLNDQHCHLALPDDSPLAIGDLVAFDISHPCTTFDKWRLIFVVDDDWRVVGALKTFF